MTQSYPSYKPTPIPWLPQIPEHWELIGFNFLFRDNKEKNKGMKESLVLSLSYGNIIRKQKDENFGLIPESFETYQVLNPGYIVLRLTDLQNDKRSLRVGYVKERGIITSAYTGLVPNKIDSRYYYYFLHYLDIKKHFYSLGGGVRQSSDYNELKKDKFPLPPLPEQTAIANYLDAKTNEISTFIEKKEKLIALLKEQKQAVINKAVTKGIRLNAPMKDSGVEWLGDIPSHWKVIKLKYIANAIIGVTYSPNDIVDERKGILVLRSSNIQNGRLSFSDNVFIKKEIPQKLLTQKGDILLCARNGSADLIGKNVCIDESAIGLTFGAFMTIVRSKYWSYLSWFFNSSIFKSQTGLFATSTINQLTSDTLNNLKIAFPTDSSEREEIIKTIEIEAQQIDLGIEKIEKEIELVKELKQSLIAEVVTGKIKIT